jgi:PAS domain S-box-containing protein
VTVQAARDHHLASIVEFSSDAIVSIDMNGIVTSWNRTAEQLFGYAAQEIIGRPGKLLYPPDCLQEEAEVMVRLKRGEVIALAKFGANILSPAS